MKIQKTTLFSGIIALFIFCSVISQQKQEPISRKSATIDSIKIDGKKVEYTPLNFATEQTLESLIKENRAVIVHYGFAPVYNPEFEKKYGIKILNMGCVVTPSTNDLEKTNNSVISNYLTKNFGDTWKKDLGFQPFGTE